MSRNFQRALALAWLTCAALTLLTATPAQAQVSGVSCSATMSAVNFGSVNLVTGTGLTTTANLAYSCTNSTTQAKTVNVCFSIGDPNGAYYDNRWLDGAGSNRLYFQMYQQPAYTPIWGTVFGSASTPPNAVSVTIPRKSGGTNGTTSGGLALYARIGTGQNLAPGTYSESYGNGDTWITIASGSNCSSTNDGYFPFTVTATVVKSCIVNATSDIDFGTKPASATNLPANGDIRITCSNTTPYYVGLAPSNGNTAGAGVMSATGGNTDKVPYQLYQNPGMSTIWGNTASASGAGNGVAGTGTGGTKPHTVYVKVPSADYQPDSYSDTVTVNVNY